MRVNLLFKLLTLSLFVLVLSQTKISFSQTTGSIGGTVFDAKDNTPLVGAIVKIEGTNLGAETDANGEFTILNLDVKTYSVIASYTGYQPQKKENIKVSVDQKVKLTFILAGSTTTTDTIEIVTKRNNGVEVDQSGRTINSQQIENQGIRGIQNIVAKTAGVVQDERGGALNIRGGRSTDNQIIIDGVSTNNPITGTSSAFVPNSLLQEISVLTGGFGAEYGNALSGVINVTTRGGTDKYTGSAEIISDIGVDKIFGTTSQGYNLYNVSFGGPLIPTKSLSKVINFYGGVERQFLNVRGPSWISDKLFPGGIIPNYHDKIWSFNGKLGINLTELKNSKVPINLRFGALVTQDYGNRFVNSYWKLNAFRMPLQKIDNNQFYGRISHNVSSKFFYELQGTYFKSKDETGDAFFMGSLFQYGDTNSVPGLNNRLVGGRGQGFTMSPAASTENIFASPNTVFNRYTLFDISYFGGKLDATWALQSKKYGDHEIKFGGEYRYNTLKKIDLFPASVADNPVDTTINGHIVTRQPDPQSLWFGRNVELNSYGYDIRDQYGRAIVSGEDVNPKHPIISDFYIRDKVDFQYFTMNLGLRMDYLNVNTDVLIDPTVLIDPQGNLLSANVYQKSKANITFSPRLGFSFPISDKTVFVANYGKFIQMPELDKLYINKLAFQYFFINSVQNVAQNSSLKPEKLTSYEVGIKQKVGENVDLGLTVYYKETRDQIGITRIAGSTTVPLGYAIYTNSDYSLSKGLDFYLSLRRMNRIAVDISYTLLYASGVGANADAKFSLANNPSGVLPIFAFPLDYDQRHTGSINVDYRFGSNDVPKGFMGSVLKNLGLNVLFSFNSGRPYTQRALPLNVFSDDGLASSNKNSVYRGWNLRTDLKLDKGFSIWKTNWDAYIYVQNLFNTELVNNVFGSTGLPGDNGYLLTPTGAAQNQNFKDNFNQRIKSIANWGTPRQIRFGLKMNF